MIRRSTGTYPESPMKSGIFGIIPGTAPVLPTPTLPLTTRSGISRGGLMPQSISPQRREKTCLHCQARFVVPAYRAETARYCSTACWGRARSERADSKGRAWYRRGESRRYDHQDVAEQSIGRPLQSDEVVHHRDGDTSNNDPSNLQVMTRAEHMRLHAGTTHRWAGQWDCCVECGTTERRHHGRGLCERCRSRIQQQHRRRKNG